MKVQMVCDSAESGLPLCPRIMRSPELCPAVHLPLCAVGSSRALYLLGQLWETSSSPAWPSSPCVEHTSDIPVVWPACWSVGHSSGQDFFIFLRFFYFILFYRSQRKWAEFLRNSCQCVSWHIPCTTEVNTFIPIVPLYEKQHCLCGSFWFSELQMLWAAQESWEPQKSSLWNEFWGVSVLIKCF